MDVSGLELNETGSPILNKDRTPMEVLQEKMVFYDQIAQDIIVEIIKALKADNKPRGDLLALMYKKFSECNDIAIDCANKLAPFKHSKLESIEVKKEVTHRFVLRAPTVIDDTQKWMDSIVDIPKEPDREIIRTITKQGLAEGEQVKRQ